MANYQIPITREISRMRKFYIPLEYYSPRKYINLSRYASTNRLYDDTNGVYYHETANPVDIPLSEADTFIKVTPQMANRLDVIANNVYGYSGYWWIIAYANKVIDPYNVPVDTVLRCPPIMSIYGEGSVLK